jgi:hypothetical protein
MFKWWLSSNGFSEEQIAKAIPEPQRNFSEHICLFFSEKQIQEAHNIFDLYMSYGIDVEKGSILIDSESDNTIPYEYMQSIETYLSACRWHIG